MIILAILASLAAIGVLCWLLFTLAVFALPAFVGATVGAWAYGTGAGVPGAILVGLVWGKFQDRPQGGFNAGSGSQWSVSGVSP